MEASQDLDQSEDVEQKSNADEQVKIEAAEVQTPEEAVEDVEQLSNADEVVKMEPAEVQTPEDVEQISSADEHLKAQKRINVPNVPPGSSIPKVVYQTGKDAFSTLERPIALAAAKWQSVNE